MKRISVLKMFCAMLFSCSIAVDGRAGVIPFRTVVLTDEQAPSADQGVVFSEFHHPAINGVGNAVFTALVVGDSVTMDNESGIWAEGTDGLRLVARAGDVAPGTDGTQVFSILGRSAINDLGDVAILAFSTATGGGDSSNEGVWVETEAGLQKASLVGDIAPDSIAAFTNIGILSPALSGFGETSVGASLSDSSWGIWSGVPAAMETVVSTSNTNLVTIGLSGFPSLNDRGETVFGAVFLKGFLLGSGVWVGDPTAIDAVAVTADPAAGTLSTFCDFGFLSNPSINGDGRTVFRATIAGGDATIDNNNGVWTGIPGEVSLVMRSGERAPGTGEGIVFNDFPFNPSVASLLINGDGDIAFYATLTGPGVTTSNDDGIWVQGDSNLRLVARAGDPAPGTAEGISFAVIGGASFDLGYMLNGAGNAAFRASLVGPDVNTSNDQGLWVEVDGVPQLVIRTGDVIEVAPGDERTVGGILSSIIGSGNEDGRASALNDLGQVVFSVYFTDCSGGVFVADTADSISTFGDADGDGDVDLMDYAELMACLGGPTVDMIADCLAVFDSDSDSDVDLRDLAQFQEQFTGEWTP